MDPDTLLRHLTELLDGPFVASEVDPLVDALIAAFERGQNLPKIPPKLSPAIAHGLRGPRAYALGQLGTALALRHVAPGEARSAYRSALENLRYA